MTEVWCDIEEFKGLYKVSTLGRVKSVQRTCKYGLDGVRIVPEKTLSQSNDKNGYKKVLLSREGKHFCRSVHQLVAQAFINNSKNEVQINHKDGNKTNNNVNNLEWCSAKENINHKFKILNYKQHSSKKVICIETGEIFNSETEAENAKGKCGIYRCLNGKRKTFAGYHWKFYIGEDK